MFSFIVYMLFGACKYIFLLALYLGVAGCFSEYCLTLLGDTAKYIFLSGCSNLHAHLQCVSILVTPHSHQHLALSVFLILAILTSL